MAFGGRSNSLSINTNAANFGGAQQNPSQPGGLFGSNAQTSQPQAGGGLFGNTNASSQPQQGAGLFGGTLGGQSQSQTQAPQSSSLFGSSMNQQSNTGGGGLFGGTSNQQSNTGGSGLFGNTSNQQNNTGGGGLFGNTSTQQSNTGGGGGGLFGSSTMPAQSNAGGGGGGGVFSGLNQNNQSQSQQQSGSLFGGSTSLFAPKPNDPSQGMAGNSFYHANNPANRQTANSVFGLNAVPPDQIPTLLRSQQFAQSQRALALAGSLRMGQNNQGGQQTAVGAVKVHAEDLRPTTRFQDCIDEVKDTFEKTDKMIQAQEHFCRQIQALLSTHETDVQSITPDVQLVKEKAEAVEQLLASDARTVEQSRAIGAKDHKDFARTQRVAENLKLPPSYQTLNPGHHPYSSSYNRQYLAHPADLGVDAATALDADAYDTDLIGNYFVPLAGELQHTLGQYSTNLAEIESHMRVIEASAVTQAQQLAAKRAGVSGGGQAGGSSNADETVMELADTLRGFEQSILGVAGTVGACREGANELVLGRLGERLGDGRGGRGR
ncbi:hypothetical protein B0A50_00550 [Salinomyces thailandicus]|uniref:Nucleoporin NUP49/NSP49 n=1 Tax=Salinomyces thailandicus TaxID=706561 RepID=A0A4U0UE72_9PEZI|nr:hypothetical protein B0A50_00550 [Salinomyces thailandica]